MTRKTDGVILLTVALLLWSPPLVGQDLEPDADKPAEVLRVYYSLSGDNLEGRGDYPGAEGKYKLAIDVSTHELKILDRRLANDYLKLASVCLLMDKIDEATKYVESAMFIQQNVLDWDDLDVACSRETLGAIYLKKRRLLEAEEHFSRAFAIRKDKLPVGDLMLLRSKANLGALLNACGKHKEAVEMLDSAMRTIDARRLDESDQDEIANDYMASAVLLNLASIHRSQGDHEAAIGHAERAILLREKLLPARPRDYAESMSLLGEIYFECKRTDEAERVVRDALNQAKTMLGDENPITKKLTEQLEFYLKHPTDFPSSEATPDAG